MRIDVRGADHVPTVIPDLNRVTGGEPVQGTTSHIYFIAEDPRMPGTHSTVLTAFQE